MCAIAAGIEQYNSIIKKNKKKHDKKVFLAKSKLNKVLISKALFNSGISYDKFVLINNVVKEYKEMKEEIKNVKTESSLFKILVYL